MLRVASRLEMRIEGLGRLVTCLFMVARGLSNRTRKIGLVEEISEGREVGSGVSLAVRKFREICG